MTLPEISPADAHARMLSGEVWGIDVREPAECAAGRAAAALQMPLSALNVDELPTDRPLVFLCRSGGRSGQVTAALIGVRSDIANMTGGMQAWQAAGLPMIADSGPPRVA